MRNWIYYIVMLAFILTTTPSFSHAIPPHHDNDIAINQAKPIEKTPSCCPHGHDKQHHKADHDFHKKPPTEQQSCCDKSCQCISHTCHGSVKVVTSNHVDLFLLPVANLLILSEPQRLIPKFYSPLERPPQI